MVLTKRCELSECRKTFTTPVHNKRYCNYKCNRRARYLREAEEARLPTRQRKCACGCGEEFMTHLVAKLYINETHKARMRARRRRTRELESIRDEEDYG